MNTYEIGFIITPEANEEECKKVVESIVATIKKSNGTIEKLDEWGLKKLSFPIQKHKQGFYVFISAEMEGNAISSVEKRLRQIEKIIRFITFRHDVRISKANKLVKRWKKAEHFKRTRESKEAVENESEPLIESEEEENHAAK